MINIYRTKERIRLTWNDLRNIQSGVDVGRRRGITTINSQCVWLFIGVQQERIIISEQRNDYFTACRSWVHQENFFKYPSFQISQYSTKSGDAINPCLTTKRYSTFRSTTCLLSSITPTNTRRVVYKAKDVNSSKIGVDITPTDVRMLPPIYISWLIHDDLIEFIRPSYRNLKIPVNRRKKMTEEVNKKVQPVKRIDITSFFTSNNKDSYDQQYVDLMLKKTNFRITILGSGAGGGSVLRSSSALLLTTNEGSFLFDAGPGVSRQIQLSRHSIPSIKYIFNHIFGLPALLLELSASNKSDQMSTINVYGPPGLYNFISANISLCQDNFNKIIVRVHELHGGSMQFERQEKYMKTVKEYNMDRIILSKIFCGSDGTWQLLVADEVNRHNAKEYYSNSRGIYVKAAEIDHAVSLPTFGYVVEEPKTIARELYYERAKELGVLNSHKLSELKANLPVIQDVPTESEQSALDLEHTIVDDRHDAKRWVHPDEVCGPAPLPRKIAILGDCYNVPIPMLSLLHGLDVLVHEATYGVRNTKAAKASGHSTAKQAGLLARGLNPKVLLLNHFDKSIHLDMEGRVHEAMNEVDKERTKVQLAYDFLELLVPESGFKCHKQTDRETVVDNSTTTRQGTTDAVDLQSLYNTLGTGSDS